MWVAPVPYSKVLYFKVGSRVFDMPPSATSAGPFHRSVGVGKRENGRSDEGWCRECKSTGHVESILPSVLRCPRPGKSTQSAGIIYVVPIHLLIKHLCRRTLSDPETRSFGAKSKFRTKGLPRRASPTPTSFHSCAWRLIHLCFQPSSPHPS